MLCSFVWGNTQLTPYDKMIQALVLLHFKKTANTLWLIFFSPLGSVVLQHQWRTASPFQKSASDDRALPNAPEDAPTLPKNKNQSAQRGQVRQGYPTDRNQGEYLGPTVAIDHDERECVYWRIIPAAVAAVAWQAVDSPSVQFLVEPRACRGQYQHQCGLHTIKIDHIHYTEVSQT